MTTIETIEYKGYTINVKHDDNSDVDPTKDWYMLGTMACWHNRYHLGHKQPKEQPQYFAQELVSEYDPSIDDIIEYWNDGTGFARIYNYCDKRFSNGSKYAKMSEMVIERIDKATGKRLQKYYIILPLYLMDHSGLMMNTGGFHCPWDSGQVGWIYVSKEAIRKEYNWKVITKKRKAFIEKLLNNEVKVYSDFIEGNVYGYTIYDPVTKEFIDSCWGFIGDYDASGLKEYATNAIDCWIEKVEDEIAEAHANEIGEIQF